jgi:surface protein
MNEKSYGMFKNMKSLISLNIVDWDTSNAINMSEMFYGCENLINLNI